MHSTYKLQRGLCGALLPWRLDANSRHIGCEDISRCNIDSSKMIYGAFFRHKLLLDMFATLVRGSWEPNNFDI